MPANGGVGSTASTLHLTVDSLPDLLGPALVLLVILGIAYRQPALRVYAAYLVVLLVAAVFAAELQNWLYFIAFCIGGLTAFTEIITSSATIQGRRS